MEKHVPTNGIWVTAATREVCSNTIFTFEDVGEFQLKGRTRPVRMYELQDIEASFVEHGTVLVITDLHNYVGIGESLPPDELNNWLMKWSNLHREAVQGIKGRVRQFIADMSLLTFTSPDEAYHALLNLKALVKIHNQQDDMPNYSFKAAIQQGDLILSPTGVVGPLVNQCFDLLHKTPRGQISVGANAFKHITDYRQQFEKQGHFFVTTSLDV